MRAPAKSIAQAFQRDGQRDFATVAGRQLLRDKIHQVLLTWGPSHVAPGEMPWRTDFGSSLHLLPHTLWDDTTAEIARTYVLQALARWLPEVRVRDVRCDRAEGGMILQVDIEHADTGVSTVTIPMGAYHAAR